MMKKLALALLASPLAGLASPAEAVTIGLVPGVLNAPSDAIYQDFDDYAPGSYPQLTWGPVTLTANPSVVDTPDANFVLGTGEIGNHFVGIPGGGSLTFSFAAPTTYFGLLWGTVDDFNTITFYDGATVVGSFTGSDLLDPPDATSAIYANFFANGGTFTSVTVTSSANSFEIDNVRVAATPLPAALGLFGSAIAAMGALGLRRRRPA
jgi:hypothetical protein